MTTDDRFDLMLDDAVGIDQDRENEVLAEMSADNEVVADSAHEAEVYDLDPTGGQPSRY